MKEIQKKFLMAIKLFRVVNGETFETTFFMNVVLFTLDLQQNEICP